ncbi:DNA alkylation repair protein [Peijinzhouia sedimentorum]
MKEKIIDKIRLILQKGSDNKTRESSSRFFKKGEKALVYGVKTAQVHKIAKEFLEQIKTYSKEDIFAICEELWKSKYLEEAIVACKFTESLKNQYEPSDFKVFEGWVNKYVNNWADCDTLCNHTIGTFIMMYPEYLSELKKWAKSHNRWTKRASAVTLIIPARRGLFLEEVFEIADTLLLDNDDIVQKGYGWMLKAASESNQKEVFDYVLSKKEVMPRTALRYAIEKMPIELKTMAMRK